ncbi:MAG: hypothetical protein HY077_03860 [Elusimicrobia bacterium]|nr:hypothetical protein [Elusimicrobiota bacterium]
MTTKETRRPTGTLLAVSVFVVIGVLAALKMGQDVDHDLFWQLKDGERVVATHQFPLVEEYSFTAAGKPMVATEWLAEAVSFAAYRAGGYGALVALNAVLFLSCFVFVFLLARRRLAMPESLGVVALIAFAFVNFYGVRAQNWTFLFTAAFLYLADRWEEGSRSAPWTMAVLLPLWANMHGGFMVGLAILVLFGLGQARRQRRAAPLAPLALGALLCCVHPNGMTALSYPIWFMASPPPGRAMIGEWRPVNFAELTAMPYLVIIVLLLWVGFGRSRGGLPWTLLTISLGALALRGRKLLPEFCLATVVPLAAGFATRGAKAARRVLLPCGLAALGALSAVVATNRRSAGRDCERYFPREAARRIAERHAGAKIFHDYDWGGYLIWKLYPRNRVFIDGRLDPYWDLLPGDYATIIGAKPGWRELLDGYGVTVALIRPTDRLFEGLGRDPAWKLEYADQRSVLFAR